MNKPNIIPTTTTTESLHPNRHRPPRRSSSRLGCWAVLTGCLLALGALNVRAEYYTLKEQVLVSGRQRLDPKHPDGQHFVRDRSAGVSTVNGLVHVSSICSASSVVGPNGTTTIRITGQIVQTTANGDQLFYSASGTVVVSGRTERALYNQVIKSKITVTGGTGAFEGAWGSGEMTCLVNSDELNSEVHFSSQMNVTLRIPGEK